MSRTISAEMLRILQLGRELHLDHYRSHRPPFAIVSGQRIRQQCVELDGPAAGETFEVIDASGAYGSACLGAGHETVTRALVRAGGGLGYATDEVVALERARLLAELFGPGGLWTDQFPVGEYHVCGRNSGSEGMELALRLVLESRFDARTLRPVPDKADRDTILGFEGAWHGWTAGLVPLLNRRHYRTGLPEFSADGPYGVRFTHLPFGDTSLVDRYFAEHGHRLLAVVVEPIQGDAGILLPEPGYLRRLGELCRRHGVLLVADEVLTFAKSGSFFAMADHDGPIPTDVTVIGKSIGMGAVSTSMIIARRELSVRSSGAVATSDLRTLTCAVIRDGLRTIVDEKLIEHSATLGEQLGEQLRTELVDRFTEVFSEVRGSGVLFGLELTEQAAAHLPALRDCVIRAGAYVEFMAGAGRRGHGRRYVFPTMRIAPPLIMTGPDATELTARIADGVTAFLAGRR